MKVRHVILWLLVLVILASLALAQKETAAPPTDKPIPLSADNYKRLQQLSQAAGVWQVVGEAIIALTPDKDAPCDKRIREQVATRQQLALSTRDSFLWKLRNEMGVPKAYVLAEDEKSFVKESKP